MKRVMALFRQDIVTALRDNLIVLILLAPLIMAVVVRVLVPSVEAATAMFAVGGDVPEAVVAELSKYGEVTRFADDTSLETRVLAVDDVMGVRMEAGEPVFFMEGTESAEMRETYQAVRMLVLSPSDISVVKTEDLGRERSPLTEVLSVAVLLMATLMGGYGAAFNMVNEKETGAIRALAVSPLNLMEFIAARGLFTLIGGAFISLVLSFVLVGVRVNIPLLLLAVLASGIVGVLFALIIGGFGSNVVNAIALMKGTMPLYLAMPILAVFLAEKWQPFFWVFPSYWQYHMLTNVFGSGTQDYTFLFTMLMTVGVSLIWAAAMFIPLKRRFRLR